MWVPEAEVRVVEGMYEKTTARLVVGEGESEEFEVKVGLIQGSLLSPLLFVDDLTLVANGKLELHESLEDWNGLFTRHGLNSNLEKMGVLHIGHQREELDIELERKKLTQGNSFVYIGGTV